MQIFSQKEGYFSFRSLENHPILVLPAKMYPRLRDSRASEPPNQKKPLCMFATSPHFGQQFFCAVTRQVSEGIKLSAENCQLALNTWMVFLSSSLHSPLHLNFVLPLLGNIFHGIRESLFFGILDSVAGVVLVNVSSLGEGFPCAAFSRAIPETFPRVLVPFPLGWERLVTYGLPLAEVGGEAQCIDPT